MHLVGVESMTTDQLKSYHSAKYDSICPGHPEIENEGVELTTGPLGQGVANGNPSLNIYVADLILTV